MINKQLTCFHIIYHSSLYPYVLCCMHAQIAHDTFSSPTTLNRIQFQILVSLTFSLPSLSPQYKEWIFPTILPSLLPLTSVTLTGSVYCVVALALERYLHMTRPHWGNKVRVRCNKVVIVFFTTFQGSFFGYILPVLAFSVFYNGPKFFEFTTEYSLNENRSVQFTTMYNSNTNRLS